MIITVKKAGCINGRYYALIWIKDARIDNVNFIIVNDFFITFFVFVCTVYYSTRFAICVYRFV